MIDFQEEKRKKEEAEIIDYKTNSIMVQNIISA